MKTAILAIILFCVMIFPHELGHFIAARCVGVKVNEFSFGMGPVLWKKQKGETLFSIRLFPIGGFCALEGEDGAETEENEDGELIPCEPDPRSFASKNPWQRIIVLASGAAMNIVCAILIMSIFIGISGFATTTIGTVEPGLPAEAAGIAAGDKVVSVQDTEIRSWTDVTNIISSSDPTVPIKITLDRSGEEYSTEIVPVKTAVFDEDGKETGSRYMIGITSKVSHDPFKAVISGTQSTWNMTKLIFSSLGMLIKGQASVSELSGPVGVVQMVSETSEYGFSYYVFLTALICVNLAVINLLPLPALDGGRIIFVIYSWITKKPVSEKVEGTVHTVGLIFLLLLMVFVTFNDVMRIFK